MLILNYDLFFFFKFLLLLFKTVAQDCEWSNFMGIPEFL
jgi:hypothetical protein